MPTSTAPSTTPRESAYARTIRESLAALGQTGAADVRHVEAYLRLEYGTLDHLDRATFTREVATAVHVIALEGVEIAEEVARSMGL